MTKEQQEKLDAERERQRRNRERLERELRLIQKPN